MIVAVPASDQEPWAATERAFVIDGRSGEVLLDTPVTLQLIYVD